MRLGNLRNSMKLFGVRLGAVEFTNEQIAQMTCLRTHAIEETVSYQSTKSREGRPANSFGITIPEHCQCKSSKTLPKIKCLTWMQCLRDMITPLESWRDREPKL